jgi:hypothetical protein
MLENLDNLKLDYNLNIHILNQVYKYKKLMKRIAVG